MCLVARVTGKQPKSATDFDCGAGFGAAVPGTGLKAAHEPRGLPSLLALPRAHLDLPERSHFHRQQKPSSWPWTRLLGGGSLPFPTGKGFSLQETHSLGAVNSGLRRHGPAFLSFWGTVCPSPGDPMPSRVWTHVLGSKKEGPHAQQRGRRRSQVTSSPVTSAFSAARGRQGESEVPKASGPPLA